MAEFQFTPTYDQAGMQQLVIELRDIVTNTLFGGYYKVVFVYLDEPNTPQHAVEGAVGPGQTIVFNFGNWSQVYIASVEVQTNYEDAISPQIYTIYPDSVNKLVVLLQYCVCTSWSNAECLTPDTRRIVRSCSPNSCDIEEDIKVDFSCESVDDGECSYETPEKCLTQTDCEDAGLYWYNNKCNKTAYKPPVEEQWYDWFTQQTVVSGVPNWVFVVVGVVVPVTIGGVVYWARKK